MRVCEKCGLVFEDSVSSCIEKQHPKLPGPRPGGCEMIEGYSVVRLLHTGSTGETFLAHHILTMRACLISLLTPDVSEAEQFVIEAQKATSLNHPNVADVYGA